MSPGSSGVFLAVFGVLLILWAVLVYNKLVRLRQLVSNSWANVETELRRRYELIPNLVETVKAYAVHERSLFESVAAARTAAVATNGRDPTVQEPPERQLITRLRGLLAVAERYPDLKASAHFLDLQHELSMTEDRIQLARRIFNANVRDINILVESIPSRFVASLAGVERHAFFEIEPASRQPPPVDLL